MDPARRHRYLEALGLESWSLRGTPAADPVPAAVAAATALVVSDAPPQDWDALRAAVAGCRKCRLCETRTNTVFGVGPLRAPLMVVGEGPGADEDAKGEPFVGRAGKLLDEMLRAIGRSRQTDTFIANVVKCLRYNALVQLGDGRWERVGRLVASGYSGEVMSVDADGALVRRRVTGWHSSPLGGRRVFRLSYASAKAAGASKTSIQLTGDHPVLTERGWVPVQDLVKGDRIATGQGVSAGAFDALCGSLLGDGHLNAASAHFSVSHSERQADYLLLKAEVLGALTCYVETLEVAAAVGGERRYPIVRFRTKAHRALAILRSQFYHEKKCVPQWIETGLTARMLAYWFMDDGHTRIREGRQPIAEIATCGFDAEDLQRLLTGLAGLGLHGKALRGRIHFSVQDTRKLSEIIAVYVPTSMRYKLHPEVEAQIPFERIRLDEGTTRVLYDEVEAIEVEPGNDQTFYCLDVEGTHNFVTSGGVVHNCRPPGNREPAEDEAEACRAYLERQLRLVQPRLIVAIGRVAAQRLLATDTPIGKMRGQTYHWGPDRTPLMVTYHPAYLLRNPSDKAKSWEDLKRIHRFLQA